MRTDFGDKGLDRTGNIRPEGSLANIDPVFRPLIEDVAAQVSGIFGDRALSVYLYGSIPRGTARIGSSDLDVLVVFGDQQESDRDKLAGMESFLDQVYEVVDGVGIVHTTRSRILHPANFYDMGFFTACLCTLLTGEDLAAYLPSYQPGLEIARNTNGNFAVRLAQVRQELLDGAHPRTACRFARKIVRTAFSLVMPRWNGWTSDFDVVVEAFEPYYPDHVAGLRRVVELARHPSQDREKVLDMFDGFGVWLRDEFDRTIVANRQC